LEIELKKPSNDQLFNDYIKLNFKNYCKMKYLRYREMQKTPFVGIKLRRTKTNLEKFNIQKCALSMLPIIIFLYGLWGTLSMKNFSMRGPPVKEFRSPKRIFITLDVERWKYQVISEELNTSEVITSEGNVVGSPSGLIKLVYSEWEQIHFGRHQSTTHLYVPYGKTFRIEIIQIGSMAYLNAGSHKIIL